MLIVNAAWRVSSIAKPASRTSLTYILKDIGQDNLVGKVRVKRKQNRFQIDQSVRGKYRFLINVLLSFLVVVPTTEN